MVETKLRLLSLDGGGVRGLSSLQILKQLMDALNPESPPRPCDCFEMIGGTSTGGLIAIMLGRLRMTVDECIDAYISLSDRVFQKRRHRVTLKGRVQGRFDSEELERAIKEIVVQNNLKPDALLNDDTDQGCKVFVCATSKETGSPVLLRSYRSQRGPERSLCIWEAARATSAASSFFDSIKIGKFGEEFIDGATGANNPIFELWDEAQNIWPSAFFESRVACLVSVGTGVPHLKSFGDELTSVLKSLKTIATESENTAERFCRDKEALVKTGRYYRFNVFRGLEDIGLEESKKKNTIVAATNRYLEIQVVSQQVRLCVGALQGQRGQDTEDKTLESVERLRLPSSSQPHDLLSNLKETYFQKDRNKKFIGRNVELSFLDSYLDRHLKSHDVPMRVVIHGLGGVGKTQLVTEWCHRIREKRQTVVFWFDATGVDQLLSQFEKHAKQLRLFALQVPKIKEIVYIYGLPGQEIELVKKWITLQEDWVMIMDNFDDISFDINRFIPKHKSQRVVFTSRDKRALGTLAAEGFELMRPELAEAELLFFRQCNVQDIDPQNDLSHHPEYNTIKEIVVCLNGFPLALSQAAAYIRENDPSNYVEYLTLLTTRQEDREVLLRFKEARPEYPESVMTTWEISLEFLKKKLPHAVEILHLLGFLHHTEIPEEFLTQVAEPCDWFFGTAKASRQLAKLQRENLKFLNVKAQVNVCLGVLASLSLISRDRNRNISVHPLVHEWIKLRLKVDSSILTKFIGYSGLVLYQAYPFHFTISLHQNIAYRNLETFSQRNQAAPHLWEYCANLIQYQPHIRFINLEVRTLLLVYVTSLTVDYGSPWHKKIYPYIHKLLSAKFPPQNFFEAIQARIFDALVWKKSRKKRARGIYLLEEIKSALDSGNFVPQWTQTEAIFIAMVTSLVFILIDDSTESLNQRASAKISKYKNPENISKLDLELQSVESTATNPGVQSNEDEYKSRANSLLYQLFVFLQMQTQNPPVEIAFLKIIVAMKLAASITFEQYWRLPYQFLISLLSLENFKYVDLQTTAEFLARCALYHAQNFQSIKRVLDFFEEIVEIWRVDESDRTVITAASFRSFISSSFGRGDTTFENIRSQSTIAPENFEAVWYTSMTCVKKLFANRKEEWDKSSTDLLGLIKAMGKLLDGLREASSIVGSQELDDIIFSAPLEREYHIYSAQVFFHFDEEILAWKSIHGFFEVGRVKTHFGSTHPRELLRRKVDQSFSMLDRDQSVNSSTHAAPIGIATAHLRSVLGNSTKSLVWNHGLWNVAPPKASGETERSVLKSQADQIYENYAIAFGFMQRSEMISMLKLWIEYVIQLGRTDSLRTKKWHEECEEIAVLIEKDLFSTSTTTLKVEEPKWRAQLRTLALVYDLADASDLSIREIDSNSSTAVGLEKTLSNKSDELDLIFSESPTSSTASRSGNASTEALEYDDLPEFNID